MQGDIYYQKNSNQNKNKAKHYAQKKILKEKKQVFHKTTSKKHYSTKKPANKKQILKISKLKKNLKNKKTFKFFLARPKVSKLRIGKRITFLCM